MRRHGRQPRVGSSVAAVAAGRNGTLGGEIGEVPSSRHGHTVMPVAQGQPRERRARRRDRQRLIAVAREGRVVCRRDAAQLLAFGGVVPVVTRSSLSATKAEGRRAVATP